MHKIVLAALGALACGSPQANRGAPTKTGAALVQRPATADELDALGYGTEAAARAAVSRLRVTCAGAQRGAELVGRAPSEWTFGDWTQSEPLVLAKLRGRVVVVRFWTRSCPFCEKSMPALQQLASELEGRPVTFIGAFHDKPAGSEPDMSLPAQVAAQWGIKFPLAFDRDWKTLRAWWLDTGHRHATSVTFVIDRHGKIAFIHPGPVFFPSQDPAAAKENAGHQAVRKAILDALARE